MTSRYWRLKAEETRVIAEEMSHDDCRRTLLMIAVQYDMLADKAGRHEQLRCLRAELSDDNVVILAHEKDDGLREGLI
jgi:hypothetical protein